METGLHVIKIQGMGEGASLDATEGQEFYE